MRVTIVIDGGEEIMHQQCTPGQPLDAVDPYLWPRTAVYD